MISWTDTTSQRNIPKLLYYQTFRRLKPAFAVDKRRHIGGNTSY
ncbi:MAG: hypothetical protein ACTS6G_01115 [Candidatus Hodgkinia cicadicola]